MLVRKVLFSCSRTAFTIQVFINRLILVHRPIQQGVIRHWISSLHDSDHSKYRAALSQLTKL